MCEVNVYFLKDNHEQQVMESAYVIKREDDNYYFLNIFGEQEFLKGKLKTIDLMSHKVILEQD